MYGPECTARLNPASSALDRDISVSIHHDSSVHSVDQMLLIWTTVNRVTRSNKAIGEEQRISVMDALHASTINAAYQFFED
ncbi:MAG: amidohydrolase family protein [Gammaproteobacteria bacterium]|nr:amidohydrolase family protein [Gammaproteobacteria bacterium]